MDLSLEARIDAAIALSRLTPAQRLVLGLCAQGYTHAEIARRMNTCPRTVRYRLSAAIEAMQYCRI